MGLKFQSFDFLTDFDVNKFLSVFYDVGLKFINIFDGSSWLVFKSPLFPTF